MANSYDKDTYQSGHGLAIANIVIFGVLIFTAVVALAGSGWMLISPDAAINLGEGDFLSPGYALIGVSALLQFPMRFLCVIVFLVWLHRVYKNLRAIGARGLEYSPGWAVGWWFIPFANLVQPFRVVRELYVESKTAALHDDSDAAPVSAENVGLWWAMFLLSNFTLRVADMLVGSGTQPDSAYFPVAYLVGQLLFALAAVWVILLIREIDKAQTVAALKHQHPERLPPPPPTFGPND